MSDEASPSDCAADSEFRRLRWHCRRGMLELDHLLNRFLDLGYRDLNDAERQLFLALLGQQDPLLSDWFMSRAEAPDADMQALVRRIVEVARVRSPGG